MSDTVPAAQEAAPGPIDYQPPATSQDALSIDDAVRLWNEPPKEEEQAEAPVKAAEQQESAQADAAPEGTTVEDQEGEPETPAIDPPRSWSKDAHERWSKLDRDTQEFLAARDSEDQKAIKRNLQEAAEARKAAEAEQATWKQERDSYVQKQAAYTKALETALQNEFGDIREFADVQKMQAEDPFRFQQWQLHQMRLGQAQAEQQANEQKAFQERQSKRNAYEAEQHKLLSDMIPEMTDPKKASELRESAVKMLTDDLGFRIETLQRWMQDDVGHEILSNAGIQKLIADRLMLKEIKAAPLKAVPKAIPPVQRPGAKQPSGAAQAQSIQALNQKLSATGNVDDALALLAAQRKAS